jgi:hypothetical protein
MDVAPSTTLEAARLAYFEQAGLPTDGGYEDAWVVVPMKPLPFSLRFPNSDARRRAVKYHDLHHVVTGYPTDLTGEAEIGAWEVATGCKGYVAAWILNLLVFGHRLVGAPTRVFRAFVRGRRSRNLYGETYDETLLQKTVEEVRGELGLTGEVPDARFGDRLAFGFWGGLAATLAWGPLIPIAWLVWWAVP